MLEFGIAHAPRMIGNEWHIIGRCVTNIHVGARFTKFVPLEKGSITEVVSAQDSGNTIPIDLTIVHILA